MSKEMFGWMEMELGEAGGYKLSVIELFKRKNRAELEYKKASLKCMEKTFWLQAFNYEMQKQKKSG